jgi:hypothetical protein
MTTPVLITDCTGLWRRTLLVEADGTRDTGTNVVWLQGITAYVDSRGFAGRLNQRGDIFEWSRVIDTQPPSAFPDAGRMHWEAGTLVEVGVHAFYTEHWVRDDGPTTPSWAVFLRFRQHDALLMRVGGLFGWADRSGVMLGSVGGPEWAALNPRLDRGEVEANGVRCSIEGSEGNVDL